MEPSQMPLPEPSGFVKTLNGMGYMTSSLDPFSLEFTRFVGHAPGPAVEIGAAYGIATIEALRTTSREFFANDIDARHLDILMNRTPAELRERLKLLPGAFPDQVNFAASSVGVVLIARVLHFFDGPTIERSAQKLFRWLAPGGKVFIVSETPYLKNFQSWIPVYENRRQNGNPWPGFVDDVMAIAPERGASLPPQMHFLDPEVLTRVFRSAGFQIERAETFSRPNFPKDLQLDGRESVGLIAIKP